MRRYKILKHLSQTFINRSRYGCYDKGWLSGTHSYTPYIILSRPRSGSNLLFTALKSHPNIICFNEVFGWDKEILFKYPGYRWWAHDPEVVKLRDNRVEDFMDNYIYRSHPPGTGAVGFKLFYRQHRKVERSVWDWLAEHPEVRIIHLQRRNALKAFVSHKLALQTKIWVGVVENIEEYQVEVNPEELINYINALEHWQQQIPKLYPEHPVQHLWFEDLVRDFENKCRMLCDFLEVPFHPMKIGTPQQGRYDLRQVVANWEEVEALLIEHGKEELILGWGD